MTTTRETSGDSSSPPGDTPTPLGDLKFVAVDLGEEPGGGWYRELPDAQVEIMSRAQLERVPLENADAETTAKEKIAEMLARRFHPHAEQAAVDDPATDETVDETEWSPPHST
jgi:hypothetical protein